MALTLRRSRSLLKYNDLCRFASALERFSSVIAGCIGITIVLPCYTLFYVIRCRTKSSKLIYLTFYFLGLVTIRRERESEICGYTGKQKHFCYILSRWKIHKKINDITCIDRGLARPKEARYYRMQSCRSTIK